MEFLTNTGKGDTRRSVTWKGAVAGDNPTIPRYAPIFSLVCASVQVVGAGSAVLQGSNDGVSYVTLKDQAGSDLSLSAGALKEFSSAAAFLKPVITGGPLDVIVTHWAG